MATESKKTCSALEAANFLVFLMKDSYDDLTNMKINKLLYYAQGHYLKEHGYPLFNEKIYAWDHGPLVKEVYGKYKSYHDKPINTCDEREALSLDDDIKSFLLEIARVYGRYTAPALRNMTHKPNTPWDKTQNETEIAISLINDYFVKYEEPIKPIEIDMSDDGFIGYHDDSGVFVLPEEWRDEEV